MQHGQGWRHQMAIHYQCDDRQDHYRQCNHLLDNGCITVEMPDCNRSVEGEFTNHSVTGKLSKDLAIGTLKSILRQAQLEDEE